MEIFRVEPTNPLAARAAPLVKALLEAGHQRVAIFGKRDPSGQYPDALHSVLWAPEGPAEGYVDAAEWLRRHERKGGSMYASPYNLTRVTAFDRMRPSAAAWLDAGYCIDAPESIPAGYHRRGVVGVNADVIRQ